MRSRALKLAQYFTATKIDYSVFPLYYDAINHSYLYDRLQKYANSPKLLSLLEKLNVSDEIRAYVLSLPTTDQGFVVSQIHKKRDIGKPELELLLEAFKNKEGLKKNTKEEILKLIPDGISNPVKNWMVIQIIKYPAEQDFLIKFSAEIDWFVEKYAIDLASYDVKSIRQAMHHTKFLNDKELSELGISNSSLDAFFHKVIEAEDRVIETANSYTVKDWARRQFFRIKREWRHEIEKNIKKSGKSFEQLLGEGKAIMDAQQAGQLRGQEMPHTPLHNAEHALLMTNLEGIGDWINNQTDERDRMPKLSVQEAVEASRKWHEEQIAKGTGQDYDPIDPSNIVYGPYNWKNEENKGYFILELKSDNDLKTEGHKMHHCVGGYCEMVRSGQSRIFSLRHEDAPTVPIITIETDSSGLSIRQDYGRNNRKIENIYHDMVNEWNYKGQENIDILKLEDRDIIRLLRARRLSEDNIIKLINSDHSVKYDLAISSGLQTKFIEALSNDKNPDVREAIAYREDLPAHIAEKLSKDPSNIVATAIMMNKTVPEEIRNAIDVSQYSEAAVSRLFQQGALTSDMIKN